MGGFAFNACAFFYYIYFAYTNGYLPGPFFYDKSDTFMDLFNPLYWAYEDGRYTEWKSVYPPLNFLFLRLLDFVFAGAGYGSASFMREHSPFIIIGLFVIYLTVPALVLKMQYGKDYSAIEKLLLYFLIIFSPPMLFALERGNLILLVPILLALAVSGKGLQRSSCIAVLINLKAYLALFLIYYLIKRGRKEFAICIGMSGAIFILSGVILDKNFLLFFSNLLNFSSGGGPFSLREVTAMPSSISAFSYVLNSPAAVTLITRHMQVEWISVAVLSIETFKWLSLIAALSVISTRSRLMLDVEIFAVLVVLISNLGVWVGGYTLIFYVVLLPAVAHMRKKWLIMSLLVLIALPFDLIPLMRDSIGVQYSYLSDSYRTITWTLGLGSILRPIANIMLLWTLMWEILTRNDKWKVETA